MPPAAAILSRSESSRSSSEECESMRRRAEPSSELFGNGPSVHFHSVFFLFRPAIGVFGMDFGSSSSSTGSAQSLNLGAVSRTLGGGICDSAVTAGLLVGGIGDEDLDRRSECLKRYLAFLMFSSTGSRKHTFLDIGDLFFAVSDRSPADTGVVAGRSRFAIGPLRSIDRISAGNEYGRAGDDVLDTCALLWDASGGLVMWRASGCCAARVKPDVCKRGKRGFRAFVLKVSQLGDSGVKPTVFCVVFRVVGEASDIVSSRKPVLFFPKDLLLAVVLRDSFGRC